MSFIYHIFQLLNPYIFDIIFYLFYHLLIIYLISIYLSLFVNLLHLLAFLWNLISDFVGYFIENQIGIGRVRGVSQVDIGWN
jgi:accessory gene regulator protein AgrB